MAADNITGDNTADSNGSGVVSYDEERTYWADDMVFPSIYYSVENIFANKIPAFDVNFINPSVKNPEPIPNGINAKEKTENMKYVQNINTFSIVRDANGKIVEVDSLNPEESEAFENNIRNKIKEINENGGSQQEKDWAKSAQKILDDFENRYKIDEEAKKNRQVELETVTRVEKNYTEIINLASDNGINLSVKIPNEDDTSENKAIGNIALQIQGTIATWYNALRNVAIVAMLSILVYIAIRIIISSASEEAKYKIMLKDWLIAIVLLFSMHYIMSFSLTITENITKMLSDVYQQNLSEHSEVQTVGNEEITSESLATSVRMAVTCALDTGEAMGYTIIYALMVIYTIMFTWQYLKRVIYMAFLTMIAPLVAMTYPIDKINDGKAQGFDMWLKEYIFNLLIQPLHLLLFIILAVSAMDLFTTSVIYSLVVLGFLLQSIKILKKFFGFDSKAPISGGGLAGGFAGGAVFSTLLNATRHIPQIGGGKSSKDSSDNGIRTANNSFELPTSSGSGLGNLSTFGGSGSTSSGRTKTNQKRLKVAKKNNNGSPKIKSAQVNGKIGSTFRNRIKQNTKPSTQSVKTSKNTNNQPRKYETARRTIRGISNLRKRYINVPKILKTTAKVGVGVIGAGTLGTIGIAGGLASDDYSDVAKYGLAGVAGGYAVGKTVGTSAANITSATLKAPSNIRDTFEQGYYGSDYSRVKSNRDYRNSREIREHYKDKYGADWEKAYKKGIELKEKAELDNQKDIEKAIKLTENGLSIEQAADLMLFRKKAEATYSRLIDEKSRKSIEKDVSNIFGGDANKVKTIMKHLDSIK